MRLRRGELARWLQAPGNRQMLREMLQLFATVNLSTLNDGELIEYVIEELKEVKV